MVNYYFSLSTFDNIDINTKKLEEIDKFTKNFKNEEELKLYLYKKNKIKLSDLNKRIIIYYKYNKKINNLDIIYKNDYKFLDPHYLRAYIIGNNDLNMLKKIYNHLYYNKSQEENLNALRYYINHTYDNKLLINSINGIIYKEAKRYKALRDLVFVVKKEQIKEEVKTKQLNFFDK